MKDFNTIHFLLAIIFFSFRFANGADIKNYDVSIKPDFNSGLLSVKTTVTITGITKSDTFHLGLNDKFDCFSFVTDDTSLTIKRISGFIEITGLKNSRQTTLTIETAGKLGKSLDENCNIISDSSLFLLWSDRFYPIAYDDWATTRIQVVLPEKFNCVAPGGKSIQPLSEGERLFSFHSEIPVLCFSVFADSRWIEQDSVVNGMTYKTLLHAESQHFSGQIVNTSSEVVSFFTQLHGFYPYQSYTFVTIKGMYARRAFPGFVGYTPEYLKKEFTTTGHDAHETSLIWWCYTNRGEGPGAFQWSEGLGDYAELLFDYQTSKPIPRIFTYFRNEYLKLEPVNDLDYTQLRGNSPQSIVHGKYPWLMRLIHYSLGDSAFYAGTRLLFQKYRFGSYTIDDLIQCYEIAGNTNLNWWKTEWLGRKGIPQWSIKYRILEKDYGFTIEGKLTQQGNIYQIPLELGVVTCGDTIIHRIEVKEIENSFVLDCKTKPEVVISDPENWIISKISINKAE